MEGLDKVSTLSGRPSHIERACVLRKRAHTLLGALVLKLLRAQLLLVSLSRLLLQALVREFLWWQKGGT